MKITDKKIDELAHLSKLTFVGEEKEAIKADLEKITGFCEKLNELDTADVKPLIYLSDNTNILRADIADHSYTKTQALANAPKTDGDFFRVPKVIKTDRG